jgi:Domain of unknown function (DUF4214)
VDRQDLRRRRGRAPDPAAWANIVTYFTDNGCSASTLAQEGEPVYLSSEFSNLDYDNAAKLPALYRGALDREPDASGYDYYLGLLNGGTSWTTIVDDFFTSSEFTGNVSTFCTEGSAPGPPSRSRWARAARASSVSPATPRLSCRPC